MRGVRIGAGEYTYELAQDWGKLPRGVEFSLVSAVAVDSQDRVYVYNRGTHPLIVFDRDGEFLGSWGEGLIEDAHGMFISSDDSVYLVDRDAHTVLKLTTEGKLLFALGNTGWPAQGAPFNHPTDAAVSPTGEVYVADGYGNSQVHKFSAQGELLASWGMPGDGPGQFKVPHGIWVDREDRVYVVDRENNRVQVFGSEGAFLTEWVDCYRPTDIYLANNETAFIVDHTPRLSIMDSRGNLMARGRLREICHAIWGDSRGDLYVALVFERTVDKYVRIRGSARFDNEDRFKETSERTE